MDAYKPALEKQISGLAESASENELDPEELGSKFNGMEYGDFVGFLREKVKEYPLIRISIVASWVSREKARQAKALFDQYESKFNIDSIIIRATREQMEEDINAFQSGVKWEEVK